MACEHLLALVEPLPRPPRPAVCQPCVDRGARWRALRICLTCGFVGCCEKSEHKHSLGHFQITGHAVIEVLHKRERWRYCYVHGEFLRPGAPGGSIPR